MDSILENTIVLDSQQKQDRELTVAQIMNSLLQNSDLNWRKQGKPLGHSKKWKLISHVQLFVTPMDYS